MITNTAVMPAQKTRKSSLKSKQIVKKGLKKGLWTRITILLGIFVLIFAAGFVYESAYQNRIFPKITVAGIKIGGLTKEKAQNLLDAKTAELNQKGPSITYNDQTITPTLEEMGVSFDTKKILEQAYAYGRQGVLKQRLTENFTILTKGYQVEINPDINQDKFDSYLKNLASATEKEPVNANLKITNGDIYLISAEQGRGLDKEKLKEDLTKFINEGENSQIVMVTSTLKPVIEDTDTENARAEAVRYMSLAPIRVLYQDKTWIAGKNQIGSWIKFTPNKDRLEASIDPTVFIEEISKDVEIKSVDKEVEDQTGNVLNEGQDGLGVDKETLANQIKEALSKNQASPSFTLLTFTVTKQVKTIYPHAQPGRYEGRYIDINLSEQTLYAFEGFKQINSFLVSTGRSGYATPTGEYHVYGKSRSTLMDGPDYYLPNVQWVSWFSGDYSIHGTYWHHNFGHVMSHGCVNASNEDAEWVYNWVDIGTPIYIHY